MLLRRTCVLHLLALTTVLGIVIHFFTQEQIQKPVESARRIVTDTHDVFQEHLLHTDNDNTLLQAEEMDQAVDDNHQLEDEKITQGINAKLPLPGSPPSCSRQSRLSFVKIHKAGSGSIHNVLLAMALRYNFSVALPHCDGGVDNYQVFPAVPKQQYLLNKPPYLDHHDYQMFFDHAVLDLPSQLEYMAIDTVFFTQLRHPFSQAESAFRHFGGVGKYRLKREISPLTKFLQTSTNGYFWHAHPCYPTPHPAPITRNFQAFTLGFMNAYQNNVTEFLPFLEQLDSELHFVGILEYGDESSLLLKRKMCWHIRDVLHIHTHKTKTQNKDNANLDMIKRQGEELHREWSKLDYILYDFYKEKLLKELEKQADDFYEELDEYRTLNSRLSELCDRMCDDFDGMSASDIPAIRRMLQYGIDIPPSHFYSAFRLTYFDCLVLVSKEIIMKKVLKVQQYPEACNGRNNVAEYGLLDEDCDFTNHVYPGYHVKYFKAKVLNKKACLGNFY